MRACCRQTTSSPLDPPFRVLDRIVHGSSDGTEATLYALLMSLSNFGVDVSSYLGAVLLWLVGESGHGLRNALIIRALARLLPIALVYTIVPHGSPHEAA